MRASRLLFRMSALHRPILQIGILFLIFRAGEWGVARFHVPLPGNIVGMMLLFGLLSGGLVRESWIQDGATLLTKHLAFFFIPIAVGLMEWGPLFRHEGHWLMLALVVSTFATLLAAGGLVHVIGAQARPGRVKRWETLASSLSPSSSQSASIR